MSSMCMAPTAERVRKSTEIDLPVVDTKRSRRAFRLIGPVEKMWRDGRIRDEQLAAFRKFERDIAITSPSRTLLARVGSLPGGNAENSAEEVLDVRAVAHKRMDELKYYLEPRALEALRVMVTNDIKLEGIGRSVLMFGNKAQAITAAETVIQQGTWTLAVFYGCITASEHASTHPG